MQPTRNPPMASTSPRLTALVPAAGGALIFMFIAAQTALAAGLYGSRVGMLVAALAVAGLLAGASAHGTSSDTGGAGPALAGTALLLALLLLGTVFVFQTGVVGLVILGIAAVGVPAGWMYAAREVLQTDTPPRAGGRVAAAGGALCGWLGAGALLGPVFDPLSLLLLVALGLIGLAVLTSPSRTTLALIAAACTINVGTALLYHGAAPAPPRAPSPIVASAGTTAPAAAARRWTLLQRSELLAAPANAPVTGYLYLNGGLAALLPRMPADDTLPSEIDDPLVNLVLAGAPGERLLLAGAATAPVIPAALSRGVQLTLLADTALLGPLLHRWRTRTGENGALRVIPDRPRRALAALPPDYDQVVLAMPPRVPSDDDIGAPLDGYRFTREALSLYWTRIQTGGVLAVLGNDEMLFQRLVLSVWDLLQSDLRTPTEFVRRAWGFRYVTLDRSNQPYEYLLLAAKGPVGEARLETLSDAIAAGRHHEGGVVVPLFGNGAAPHRDYRVLYHPMGLDNARHYFASLWGKRLKQLLDLGPTSDDRPFFFAPARKLDRYALWTFASCLAALALIMLLPLPALRRIDRSTMAEQVALPLQLGYFAATTCAAAMGTTALIHQATLPLPSPDIALLSTVAGIIAGAATATASTSTAAANTWRTIMVLLATPGSALLIGSLPPTDRWPVPLTLLVSCVTAFLLGLATTIILLGGVQRLRTRLPALIPWAWLSAAVAVPTGVPAAVWLAQQWGWSTVWLVTACSLAVLAGLRVWLCRRAIVGPAGAIEIPAYRQQA